MRAIFLFFFIFISALNGFAQTVEGFVINKTTRQRLAKVYIYNERTDEGIYNNGKGEFKLTAKYGDVLFAALEGYAFDTVIYQGQSAIYFQLAPLAIQIEQVDILAVKLTPWQQYQKNVRDYKYQTDKGSSKNLFTLGSGGVGLGIDAIFNLLSKQGKNARNLQRILERDYRESIIDYRYKSDVVARILQISDPELKDFMQQYRPTYTFVLSASEYTFTLFIKNSYASYKRAPTAFRLPALPKIEPAQ